MRQSVKQTKALAQAVKGSLPERLLKGDKPQSLISAKKRKTNNRAELDRIEASYNQLDGEWLEWLEVARRYEVKVPTQDRLDVRHDIMITLATVRQGTGEPIPQYRAYRVASYTIADYYFQEVKLNRGLDCKHCATAKRRECVKYSLYSQYPKIRRVISLEAEYIDGAGEAHHILDIVADDNAIDLDDWLDADTFIRGCPTRLRDIAVKTRDGKPLDSKDRNYLWHYRRKTQKPLF